jgi:hypothetical protein
MPQRCLGYRVGEDSRLQSMLFAVRWGNPSGE